MIGSAIDDDLDIVSVEDFAEVIEFGRGLIFNLKALGSSIHLRLMHVAHRHHLSKPLRASTIPVTGEVRL